MSDIQLFEGVLANSRQRGNRQGEASALGALGNLYAGAGNIPKALEYLKESLRIYESMGDSSGIALTYYNLAATYGEGAGDIQQAIQFLEKAVAYAPNESTKERYAKSLTYYQQRG